MILYYHVATSQLFTHGFIFRNCFVIAALVPKFSVEHFYHQCRHQTLPDNEEKGKSCTKSGVRVESDYLCQYKWWSCLAGLCWFSCYVNLCHEEMMDVKSKKALYLTAASEWVKLLLQETVPAVVLRLFQANPRLVVVTSLHLGWCWCWCTQPTSAFYSH